MAEIKFSAIARQCLDGRIPDLDTLQNEVANWCNDRNRQKIWLNWRFTTKDARIKLKRLYPSLN